MDEPLFLYPVAGMAWDEYTILMIRCMILESRGEDVEFSAPHYMWRDLLTPLLDMIEDRIDNRIFIYKDQDLAKDGLWSWQIYPSPSWISVWSNRNVSGGEPTKKAAA